MKLRELKKLLDQLPKKCDGYEIAFDSKFDEDTFHRLEQSLTDLSYDEKSKTVVFEIIEI